MTALTLLRSLKSRGFTLAPAPGGVAVKPASQLTDRDREAIRAHKPGLLKLLARPPLGSIKRPVPVRGLVMPMTCLWDNCNGWLNHKKGRRPIHQCSECESWFELLPPEKPGVPVHDLAEDVTVSAMIN